MLRQQFLWWFTKWIVDFHAVCVWQPDWRACTQVHVVPIIHSHFCITCRLQHVCERQHNYTDLYTCTPHNYYSQIVCTNRIRVYCACMHVIELTNHLCFNASFVCQRMCTACMHQQIPPLIWNSCLFLEGLIKFISNLRNHKFIYCQLSMNNIYCIISLIYQWHWEIKRAIRRKFSPRIGPLAWFYWAPCLFSVFWPFHQVKLVSVCVCVCVCARARARARACVYFHQVKLANVCVCVCVCVRAWVLACVFVFSFGLFIKSNW